MRQSQLTDPVGPNPADADRPRARVPWWPIAAGLLGLTLAGAGLAWWDGERRAERRLLELREAAEAGRIEVALDGLRRFVTARPGSSQARLLLGLCERAAGQDERAMAAWRAIPARTPEAAQAALLHGELAMELGRFADADAAFRDAARAPSLARDVSRDRARLLRYQLRLADLRDHLRRATPATTRAKALRDLAQLDFEPIPVQLMHAYLDERAPTAGDDDYFLLARANLAILTGDLDEARDQVGELRRRRPDDPAVARARLEWARAADRPDEALAALGAMPQDAVEPAERFALDAWFAEHAGDEAEERRALGRLLEVDPGDVRAVERLTILAAREGRPDEVARLHRLKEERNRARNAYLDALARSDYADNTPTLARLAEALGRRFEARGWAAIALQGRPADAELLAILDRNRGPDAPPPSLAELRGRWRSMDQTREGGGRGDGAGGRPGRLAFSDDATASGLVFSYRNGRTPVHQLPETMGGGVGLIDFDGDGRLDVYCVQGGAFPPTDDAEAPGDRLFRNLGDGTFADVTEAAGLAGARGYGFGVAVGDVDNDGHPDLFVTRWGAYALYRNRGDGTFEDATAAWGLDGGRDWPTSAAFADLDNDGDLDLYVAHYLRWKTDPPKLCTDPKRPGYVVCAPNGLPALPDRVFRNDGGRFADVTEESGVGRADREGRGLGVLAADLDADGRVDVFVANDTTANFLFRNLGGWRFEESAQVAGVAANAQGGYQAGMGVALGDVNRDGLPDLAVTNYFGESTTLFAGLADGLFADETASLGVAVPSRYLLGFGVALADLDDDGRLDMLTANGHVADLEPDYPYAMTPQVLLGRPDGRFAEFRPPAGSPLALPRVGRGLAVGDLDNDGRLDALLVDQSGPLAYLHNRSRAGGSLTLALEGTASNRDAIGAVVAIETAEGRQTAWRFGGGSYLAAGDPRLHFGLGAATRADSVEVRWPSGRVDRYADLPAGTRWRLREGDTEPHPLP
jgi:tetratricopeptide (TPR) repeat protein